MINNTMQQNDSIRLEEFTQLHKDVLKSYEVGFEDVCSKLDRLQNLFFENEKNEIEVKSLYEYTLENDNKFDNSLIRRLIGVREIIFSRQSNEILDIKFVWNLIKDSINLIPSQYIISSIGSQGFLSIPLYKSDEELNNFDFIRLHIWDDSLDELMDLEKNENFSIHSHTFFARSWIITGKIINNRYDYTFDHVNSTHSLFKVHYNDSLNKMNKHTSIAKNENINVELKILSEELHFPQGYYEISSGKLHQSGHKDSPNASATFFSFTGKEGLSESIAIGPRHIQFSEVNRKIIIDPTMLIEKIHKQLN